LTFSQAITLLWQICDGIAQIGEVIEVGSIPVARSNNALGSLHPMFANPSCAMWPREFGGMTILKYRR